jgi:hypothetical protein
MDYDFKEYQWVFADGRLSTVKDMTPEELKLALCETIDVMENVESACERVKRIVQVWKR